MSLFIRTRRRARKPMHKIAMVAALHRLRAELDTLMEAAPAPPGMLRRAEVHVNWSHIEQHVRELWGHENGN